MLGTLLGGLGGGLLGSALGKNIGGGSGSKWASALGGLGGALAGGSFGNSYDNGTGLFDSVTTGGNDQAMKAMNTNLEGMNAEQLEAFGKEFNGTGFNAGDLGTSTSNGLLGGMDMGNMKAMGSAITGAGNLYSTINNANQSQELIDMQKQQVQAGLLNQQRETDRQKQAESNMTAGFGNYYYA